MNPLDFTAGPSLAFYISLAALAWLIATYLRRNIGDAERPHRPLSAPELAYLAGGERRVGDAVLVELLTSEAAKLSSDGRTIEIDGSKITGRRDLADFASLGLDGEMRRGIFQVSIRPAIEAIRTRLEGLGLTPRPSDLPAYRAKVLLLFAVPFIFGIAKANVGIERDKPVGFLVILMIGTAIVMFNYLVAPRLSRAGRAVLAASQKQNARAARAPIEGELPLAVALTGLVVLSGTEFNALHAASQASDPSFSFSTDSGGGGGGDGGGDGGGGCGGGGCGGCGGS